MAGQEVSICKILKRMKCFVVYPCFLQTQPSLCIDPAVVFQVCYSTAAEN